MPDRITSLTQIPEVALYLHAIGAEPRSFTTAVVKLDRGEYWKDIAIIRFLADGTIVAPQAYAPSDAVQKSIRDAWGKYEFPHSITIPRSAVVLPPELQSVPQEQLFYFYDRDDRLVMIQNRVPKREGGKSYLPWTPFDDGSWYMTQPDGPLPIYNVHRIKPGDTVFIHEGAKAARNMQRIIDQQTDEDRAAFNALPWKNNLAVGVHIGWIGGALNPRLTDWGVLHKLDVKNAFIIPDNDEYGIAAVPQIAERLHGMNVYSIRWNDIWPASFDLGDQFPILNEAADVRGISYNDERFFKKINGVHHYVGPTFHSLIGAATCALDYREVTEGRKVRLIPELRDEFIRQWLWVADIRMFVHRDYPNLRYKIEEFNIWVKPFARNHDKVADLLHNSYLVKADKLVYRPDVPKRVIADGLDARAVNTFIPTQIEPDENGNSQPWQDFLDYLFPVEAERNHMARWIATLIAKPEIRMAWSVLLCSATQGIGKTTLGEHILAPLVGLHNCSFPSEDAILDSQFQGWLANKRLVVIAEIHGGQTWKAYQKMKRYLTDKNVLVNEKYVPEYTVSNWAHFFTCSNSDRPMKLDKDDRRWFFPTVIGSPWSGKKFVELYNWIESGGLNIIMHWALNYGDYVRLGEIAPRTQRKDDLIEESLAEEFKLLSQWCEENDEIKCVIGDKRLKSFIRSAMNGHEKVHSSPLEQRKHLTRHGWLAPDDRIKHEKIMQSVVISKTLAPEWMKLIETATRDERRDWLRQHILTDEMRMAI
jgi:uncharacterized protein DUF5906